MLFGFSSTSDPFPLEAIFAMLGLLLFAKGFGENLCFDDNEVFKRYDEDDESLIAAAAINHFLVRKQDVRRLCE